MPTSVGGGRGGSQVDPAAATVVRPAPALTQSRTFPATADQARTARRFLAASLNRCTPADDALICLSELVANAIRHSNSRRPGGTFTVRASAGHGRLRVEVEDQGGPWRPSQGPDGQGGRGLLVVDQLTTAWGISGNGTARVVWFEMDRR